MYNAHNMEIPGPQIHNQDKTEILQICTKKASPPINESIAYSYSETVVLIQLYHDCHLKGIPKFAVINLL